MPKLTANTAISASMIPGLLGMSRFKSRGRIIGDLALARAGLAVKDEEYSEPAQWGNIIEPLILDGARDRLGLKVWTRPLEALGPHPSAPLYGTPDAFGHGETSPFALPSREEIWATEGLAELRGPGVIEAKLTSRQFVPPDQAHELQLQAYLALTGYRWGVVAVLQAGIRLRLYVHRACAETQAALLALVREVDAEIEQEAARLRAEAA